MQARLFQPFQQGSEGQKKGGTGLGLALSRQQVELMGGELRVESRLGEGSRFHFTLPLVTGDPEAKVESPKSVGLGARLKKGCQVSALVVDDNPQNREVLSRMLADVGCQAWTALRRPGGFANQAGRARLLPSPDLVSGSKKLGLGRSLALPWKEILRVSGVFDGGRTSDCWRNIFCSDWPPRWVCARPG